MPSTCFVVCLLTALIYSKQNVGEYGLTEGIRAYYLPIGSSGIHTLFAAENLSVYEYQKRTLFTVNDSHNVKRAVGSFLRDASLGK